MELKLAALALMAGTAMAQDDDCASAAPIAGIGGFPFTTVGATDSGLVSSCGNTPSADAWFAWTAGASGSAYRFSICDTDFDAVLAVLDACDGNELGCEDTAGCTTSVMDVELSVFGLAPGMTYLIQIDGWQGETGSGTLEIEALAPPSNDDCSNATPISDLGLFPWDNMGATTDGLGDPSCDIFGTDQISSDVWFLWTALGTAKYQVDTCALTGHDTRLAVYDAAACPPTNALDCNDDDCGAQSLVTFDGTGGNTYLIRIGSFSDTAQGSGELLISSLSGPPVLGSSYCQNTANSSGSEALISAGGSTSITAQSLMLRAENMPPNVNGIFFYGTSALSAMFGDGVRCVGGLLQRLPVNMADTTGVMTEADVYGQPMNVLPLAAGTFYFQAWFRDPNGPGGSGFNLSNGVEITFIP